MPSYLSLTSVLAVAALLLSAKSAAAVDCPNCDSRIAFVNFKNLTPDGSASAIIVDNKCPVLLTPAQKKVNVDYQDPKKSTQVYKVPVYEQQCTFDGGYFGSTFKCLDSAGQPDASERFYEDGTYKAMPCPAGCESACTKLDPKWETDAKMMFQFRWESAVKEGGSDDDDTPTSFPAAVPKPTAAPSPSDGTCTKPKQTVTSTITVTRQPSASASSDAKPTSKPSDADEDCTTLPGVTSTKTVVRRAAPTGSADRMAKRSVRNRVF